MSADLGRTLLVANPAAQRGNGAQAADIAYDLLSEWLGADSVEFVLTERSGHAMEIASQAPIGRCDTLIALGGDGVVHEAVNGLMQLPAEHRPRFGLIPVGSGNDYARTLGISESVPDAIVQFLDAHEVVADLGCCNGEYFTETLSFGLDAAIALDTVERRKRTGEQGTVLYMKSGIDQLLHHLDTYEYKAQLRGGDAGEGEERVLSGKMHMFAVQVGPTYGGGFRICPEASITDGLLDICYAEAPMNVIEATVKFLSAKNAHHTKWKKIFFERASSLELEFDRRPPCQIDGEPHIADSYSISVAPAALRVLHA
ncbi:MAG: diacylglycerol kinase family lipid kinase [Eggerthellaceae bacterium]|nr:diacylglycerol kinase family lipid kinase [Eggerthellaceae bacterium]